MKKAISSLALTALFGIGAAIAAPQSEQQAPPPQADQANHRRPIDPNRQLKTMTRRLNLTADQQNQILPILTSRQQQMQAIFADNSLSPKDRHEKMRAVRESSNSQIRALLNADQQQTYDQMLQRQHSRRNS